MILRCNPMGEFGAAVQPIACKQGSYACGISAADQAHFFGRSVAEQVRTLRRSVGRATDPRLPPDPPTPHR